jgi:hypothetical protein
VIRGVLAFAAAGLVLIGGAALVLGRFYTGAADQQAIWISAVIAYLVQLLTFVMLKLAGPKNAIAAWGVGVGVRFVTLIVFMILVSSALHLSTSAPLFLAVFFFVTMVVEPLLLSL